MKKTIILGTLAIICGCASTEGNLQRESARAIGRGTKPEEVRVLDIDRGISSVKWTALTPKGKFGCSSDDMVRRVYCTK
jgi:hypothetical protein